MPIRLQFDFFGIRVSLSSSRSDIEGEMRYIAWAFQYFLVESNESRPAPADISIHVVEKVPVRGFPVFRFRGARAFGFIQRTVSYPTDHIVYIERSKSQENILISGPSEDALKELLFTVIQSQVGWALEEQGWLRLHAASVLENGKPRIFFGDSGAGKSTWIANLVRSGASIWSDETTWVTPEGKIHPWPVPIQLSENSLNLLGISKDSVPYLEKRLWPGKFQMEIPLSQVAKPVTMQGLGSPYGKWGLMRRIVTGKGLAQILEFNMRLDMLIPLSACLSGRIAWVLRIFRKKEITAHALSWSGQNSL